MTHSMATRVRDEEHLVRSMLESSLLRGAMMFAYLLVLAGIAVGVLFLRP